MRGFFISNINYVDCCSATSVLPATELLLITADSANIITANITVVSLIPRDDDLFMVFPNNRCNTKTTKQLLFAQSLSSLDSLFM